MFRAWSILVAIVAVGCTSPDDQTSETGVGKEEAADMAEEPRKELDLSMPENFFADGVEITGEPTPDRFNAAELFDKDDGESVKVTVMPNFEDARDHQGLPDVDGATVTVETKTQ